MAAYALTSECSFSVYLDHPSCNSFYLAPTSSTEIEDIISNLKTGKSVGPFSLPIKLLLSQPLEILCNYSFNNGLLPDCF